jgi:hypothetical protein
LTHEERVQAVVGLEFTDRQARFLVLVLRMSGVCVPRQYATFAGIAHGGKKCNAFFDKLVRRGTQSRTRACTIVRGSTTSITGHCIPPSVNSVAASDVGYLRDELWSA